MTRCDDGHEHETLDAAVTCVRARTKATPQGVQKSTRSAPEIPIGSHTVFRYSRAGKSGRPRVALSEQRRKARERVRAYRGRQKQAVA
jgi:hypothetical protein